MVNNSININKTNNLISPSHWTQKRPQNLTLEIQVLAWDRHKYVAGLNRLMGFQPSHIDSWISNGKTYQNKHLKNY